MIQTEPAPALDIRGLRKRFDRPFLVLVADEAVAA